MAGQNMMLNNAFVMVHT